MFHRPRRDVGTPPYDKTEGVLQALQGLALVDAVSAQREEVPLGDSPMKRGVVNAAPYKFQGRPQSTVVGADAHIGPPSNGKLSRIERVDVGIDPYNKPQGVPSIIDYISP